MRIRVRRCAVLLFGFGLAGVQAVCPVTAGGFVEVGPAETPRPFVATDESRTALPITPVQPAPAPAEVVQPASVPMHMPVRTETSEPIMTGSIRDVVTRELVLPEPPAAPAMIGEADAVAGAIELRLADARGLWLQRSPKKDRDAIAAFYSARADRPVWIAAGSWSAAARAVIGQLERAAEDGLDAADYPIPAFTPGSPPSPAVLAEAELKLSATSALYARDARGGRIEPSRLSALVTPKLDLPSSDTVLAELASSASPAEALERYNPGYPGYLALKRKLAELRADRPVGAPSVRRQQRQVLTTQAIASLDDEPVVHVGGGFSNPRLEGDIIANMERWRWLPKDVAPRYILVNIPEFRLRILEGSRVVHETRVITGKPDSPTPLFSGLVEYAVVNPSWFIPPSIMKKEFLPGLAADPSYAAKRGYEVVRHGSAISVRQPPGERNALGFIKFMFPNGHAVYLHDTPNRNLFSSGRRAFSHGCVRVEQPFQLADQLLGSAWTETRLRKLIGHGERTIWLPEKTPVHLGYFTTSVDEYGELRSFEDVYGYNRKVRMALGLGA